MGEDSPFARSLPESSVFKTAEVRTVLSQSLIVQERSNKNEGKEVFMAASYAGTRRLLFNPATTASMPQKAFGELVGDMEA